MSGQSKRGSMCEAIINVLIGYGIAILAQKAIFPIFGIHVSTQDNLLIGAAFTIVSLVRSYCLRRLFNWWHVRQMYRSLGAALNASYSSINQAREYLKSDGCNHD